MDRAGWTASPFRIGRRERGRRKESRGRGGTFPLGLSQDASSHTTWMRRADACCRSSDAAPLLVSRATAWQSMSLPAGEKQSWTSVPAEPWSGLFGSSARMTLVIPPASSALVSAKLDPLPLLRPNFHLSAFQRVLLRSERPGCGYQTRSRPRDGPEAA